MIGMHVFEIDQYYFARRSKKRVGFRSRYQTTEGHIFSNWVDIPQPGSVDWSPRSDKWKVVYSGGGWVRVDGLSLLTPEGTMNTQVQSRPLPREECDILG
jgi:hypothetical protein